MAAHEFARWGVVNGLLCVPRIVVMRGRERVGERERETLREAAGRLDPVGLGCGRGRAGRTSKTALGYV